MYFVFVFFVCVWFFFYVHKVILVTTMLDLVSPTAMAVNYTRAQTQLPPHHHQSPLPPPPEGSIKHSQRSQVHRQHSSLVTGYKQLIKWSNNQLVLNLGGKFYVTFRKGCHDWKQLSNCGWLCSNFLICGTLRTFKS